MNYIFIIQFIYFLCQYNYFFIRIDKKFKITIQKCIYNCLDVMSQNVQLFVYDLDLVKGIKKSPSEKFSPSGLMKPQSAGRVIGHSVLSESFKSLSVISRGIVNSTSPIYRGAASPSLKHRTRFPSESK